jgi:xanthine/uracil permease
LNIDEATTTTTSSSITTTSTPTTNKYYSIVDTSDGITKLLAPVVVNDFIYLINLSLYKAYVNYVAFTTIEELIGKVCKSFDSNKDTKSQLD